MTADGKNRYFNHYLSNDSNRSIAIGLKHLDGGENAVAVARKVSMMQGSRLETPLYTCYEQSAQGK